MKSERADTFPRPNSFLGWDFPGPEQIRSCGYFRMDPYLWVSRRLNRIYGVTLGIPHQRSAELSRTRQSCFASFPFTSLFLPFRGFCSPPDLASVERDTTRESENPERASNQAFFLLL